MSISDFAARLGGWPRRVAAAVCLLLAGVTAVGARDSRPQPAGHSVVVAARDLPVGATLRRGDLDVQAWPAGTGPPNGFMRPEQVIGRQLAAAIRRGEPLTSSRLAGADLTVGLPAGLQAVPVQLSDVAAMTFLHAGDWVDLLAGGSDTAGGPSPGRATLLAEGVRVLAVPGSSVAPSADGRISEIVVAADRATALRIAAVAGRAVLATLRVPP